MREILGFFCQLEIGFVSDTFRVYKSVNGKGKNWISIDKIKEKIKKKFGRKFKKNGRKERRNSLDSVEIVFLYSDCDCNIFFCF